MNRGLNLPSIQRIMNEFEKESATMDMKEEMMSDAVDDVMDDEAEDEEEEGDKILREVLDEIGVGLQQQLTEAPTSVGTISSPQTNRPQAVAIGESDDHSLGPSRNDATSSNEKSSPNGRLTIEDSLQARLDNLRKL